LGGREDGREEEELVWCVCGVKEGKEGRKEG